MEFQEKLLLIFTDFCPLVHSERFTSSSEHGLKNSQNSKIVRGLVVHIKIGGVLLAKEKHAVAFGWIAGT